jgi:hypothetical protein
MTLPSWLMILVREADHQIGLQMVNKHRCSSTDQALHLIRIDEILRRPRLVLFDRLRPLNAPYLRQAGGYSEYLQPAIPSLLTVAGADAYRSHYRHWVLQNPRHGETPVPRRGHAKP